MMATTSGGRRRAPGLGRGSVNACISMDGESGQSAPWHAIVTSRRCVPKDLQDK